ncbi:hypothetical protein AB0C07_04580 [Actinoplanes missouriensis]|uniref:hypothetical protein n=1 Tax=Actinoplanes missouriensis TaxID=1866 RepID=UPI00340776C4
MVRKGEPAAGNAEVPWSPAPVSGSRPGETLDPPAEHWASGSSWAPISFDSGDRPPSSVDALEQPPSWSAGDTRHQARTEPAGWNESLGRSEPAGWNESSGRAESGRGESGWGEPGRGERGRGEPAGRSDAGVWNEPVVWGEFAPANAGSAATGQGTALRERPRQSRVVTFGMIVLGVVALAAITLTGIIYYSGPDSRIPEMLQLGTGGTGGNEQTVSAPLDGRTIGSFELLAATDRVRVRIADLGADLYRISAAGDSGISPNPELRDDAVRLDVSRTGDNAGGEIEVLLSAEVRWTLRFSGYAAERVLDLSEGRVSRIEVVGGTRRAEVTLAKASGTVPMKITGGMEELLLRAPVTSPVRVKVGGGAATVTAGARTLKDVAPGSTLTPKDWQNADRYDVDAAAPITLLTVENAK